MTDLARKITDAIMDYHDTDAPMTDGAVLGIVQDVLKDHDPIRDINEELARQVDGSLLEDTGPAPLNITYVDFGARGVIRDETGRFMTATSNGTKTHHMVGDFCHELPGTGWEFAIDGRHHYAVHPDHKPLRLSPNGEQVTLGYLNAQEAAG